MSNEGVEGNWCLIESDPAVFNELISGFGVKGVQMEEIFALDDTFLDQLKPIYGLVFLFKWRDDHSVMGRLVHNAPGVFFTRQVITNACASQAIINLLMNIHDEENVELGPVLQNFRDFTEGFDPKMRGSAMMGCDAIRTVHNSFAQQQFVEVNMTLTSADDAFHFVAYLPIGDSIYELDGLQEAPIKVAELPPNIDWIHVVTPIIQQRMQKYSAGEVHFNLMAMVQDRKVKSERRLAELAVSVMDAEEMGRETGRLQAIIADEEEKRTRYKVENNRRRHNYTPFILELLKILAREGRLVPLTEKAIVDAKKKKAASKTQTGAVKKK